MRTRPDITREIRLPDGRVSLDEAGYLTDPSLWTPDFARYIAEADGIELGDMHWEVLEFMRDFHDEHGVAADVRFVLKFLTAKSGTDKKGAKQVMFSLFPQGYVKQACKIAGMRQPRAWSTG